MLTAERHKFILEELREKGSVLNTELMRELEASESTIRRDISRLAKEGRCQRVHGGAILPESLPGDQDDAVTLRQQRHRTEKLAIAREAAGWRADLSGRGDDDRADDRFHPWQGPDLCNQCHQSRQAIGAEGLHLLYSGRSVQVRDRGDCR